MIIICLQGNRIVDRIRRISFLLRIQQFNSFMSTTIVIQFWRIVFCLPKRNITLGHVIGNLYYKQDRYDPIHCKMSTFIYASYFPSNYTIRLYNILVASCTVLNSYRCSPLDLFSRNSSEIFACPLKDSLTGHTLSGSQTVGSPTNK